MQAFSWFGFRRFSRSDQASGVPAGAGLTATSAAGKRITKTVPVGKLSSTRIVPLCSAIIRLDGESQSGTAFLGGKMRKKQPLFILRRNSVAAIGDDNFDSVAFGLGAGGHPQTPD